MTKTTAKSFSYNKSVEEDSGVILRVTGYVEPFYTELDLDKKPRNFGINIIANGIEGNSSPSPELFLYAMASIYPYKQRYVGKWFQTCTCSARTYS